MITSAQIRAARAMLRMEQKDLAKKAGVSVETIKRLEKMVGTIRSTEETVQSIIQAFEESGVEFVDAVDHPFFEGQGVILKDPESLRLYSFLRDLIAQLPYPVVDKMMNDDKDFLVRGANEIVDNILAEIMERRDPWIKEIERYRVEQKRRPLFSDI